MATETDKENTQHIAPSVSAERTKMNWAEWARHSDNNIVGRFWDFTREGQFRASANLEVTWNE